MQRGTPRSKRAYINLNLHACLSTVGPSLSVSAGFKVVGYSWASNVLVIGRLSGWHPVQSCRSDRRLKEKDMQIEEERNRAQRAEEQLTRLNAKTKTLRRQVDDAVRSYRLTFILPPHYPSLKEPRD